MKESAKSVGRDACTDWAEKLFIKWILHPWVTSQAQNRPKVSIRAWAKISAHLFSFDAPKKCVIAAQSDPSVWANVSNADEATRVSRNVQNKWMINGTHIECEAALAVDRWSTLLLELASLFEANDGCRALSNVLLVVMMKNAHINSPYGRMHVKRCAVCGDGGYITVTPT